MWIFLNRLLTSVCIFTCLPLCTRPKYGIVVCMWNAVPLPLSSHHPPQSPWKTLKEFFTIHFKHWLLVDYSWLSSLRGVQWWQWWQLWLFSQAILTHKGICQMVFSGLLFPAFSPLPAALWELFLFLGLHTTLGIAQWNDCVLTEGTQRKMVCSW